MNLQLAQVEWVPEVADLLRRGGVIVYPTETVYGLGCIADDARAAERIAVIKGSHEQASFLILVHEFEMILNYAAKIPDSARVLAKAFWPGPLTLILPALPELPSLLKGPTGGVGLRVSPHPWARALVEELGVGLVSTSANLHGRPAPVSLMELDQQVGDQADLIIDGGALAGVPSTVLDLCVEPPLLRREGAVSRAAIEAVVGKIG
jgi:L-threonylcarbamoyladenylate synthase